MRVLLFGLILLLSNSEVTEQYQCLSVSLKTNSLYKVNNYVEVHIRTDEGQSVVSVQSYSIDEKTGSNFISIDTNYVISKASLNKLGEMLLELSSTDIYRGISLSEPIVSYDGYKVNLSYGNDKDEIKFSVWSPDYKTKERSLTQFYSVCKEVLKLSHLKYKEVLR